MAFAVVLLGRQLAGLVRELPAMVEERLGGGGEGELPPGPPPARMVPPGRRLKPADQAGAQPATPAGDTVESPREQLEIEDEPIRHEAEPDEPIHVRRDDGAVPAISSQPVVLVTDE